MRPASTDQITEMYLETAKTGQEPLLPGLTEYADVRKAVDDPSTVFDPTDRLPVAHDIDHNSWYKGRDSFFSQEGVAEHAIGENGLFYYAGHAAMAASLATTEQRLVERTVETAGRDGLDILFEHSGGAQFRDDVMATARELGVRATWLLGGGHALYASKTGYQAKGGGEVDDFFSSVYEASSVLAGAQKGVDVVPKIKLEEYPDLFDEYEAAFAAVSAAHPTGSTLTREDFTAVLGSDDFMKFVAYDDRGVSGLCVLAKVQDINWFDQDYMSRTLGPAYDKKRGLACPMIYRRNGAGMMQSLRIFTAMGTVFKAIDTYPEFIIESNGLSIQNIPRLFELGSRVAETPSSDWEVLQRQAVDVLRVQR